MRHFQYTPPHNDWGTKKRQTVQSMFQWGVRREPRPLSAKRVNWLKFDQILWRAGRKPNRTAVGTIRAMGAMQFFRGCYRGAEND